MKNKIRILAQIFLFISIINSFQQGCLLTLGGQTCEICDFLSDYFLTAERKCLNKKIENCQTMDISGNCLQCKTGYFLDSSVALCVLLGKDKEIKNCLYYSSSGSCAQCQEKFYLNSINCLAIETPIENCAYYESKTKCFQCSNGFIRNINKESCLKIEETTPNCSGYSFIFCKECSSEYTLNLSYSNFYYTSSQKLKTKSFQELQRIKEKNLTALETLFCQQIVVPNCKEIVNYKTCKVCSDKFFLTTDGLCQAYPQNIILNCAQYSNLFQCKQCEAGYHLTSSFECQINEVIQNCKTYSTQTIKTSCVLCQDLFYLFNSDSCLNRTYSTITECIQYSKTLDQCEKCNEGFKITNDGIKCLQAIANCFEYQFSSSNSTIHKCQICVSGYKVDNNFFCVLGQDPSCQKYKFQEEKCEICKNGFYLTLSGTCNAHKAIENCLQYSSYNENECVQCKKNSVLFSVTQMCLSAVTIPGCKIYQNKNICQICEEGYEKIESICQLITIPANCLVKNDLGNCDKCLSGFIKQSGKCYESVEFVKDNCLQNNLESGLISFNDSKCIYCNENTIPINYNGKFVCLKNIWIGRILTTPQENCLKIDDSGNNSVCVRCKPSFFIAIDPVIFQVICQDSCPINGAKYLAAFTTLATNPKNYKLTKTHYCGTTNINCAEYSIKVRLANYTQATDNLFALSDSCIKCQTGYVKEIDFYLVAPNSKTFPSLNAVPLKTINFEENNGFQTSPVNFFPEITNCRSEVDASVNVVSQCEYYFRFSIINKTYCIKCLHGYAGQIFSIPGSDPVQFYIKYCLPIEDCVQIFYPGLSTALNVLVTCHECSNGKKPILFAHAGGRIYSGFQSYVAYDPSKDSTKWVTENTTSPGKTMKCMNELDNSLIPQNQTKNFPTNCVIFMFNVYTSSSASPMVANANIKNSVNVNELGMVCLACQKGYKMQFAYKDATDTESSLVPYVISGCIEIANCAQSSWFNYCSQCNPKFAFLYISSVGVDYSFCIRFDDDENCFAVYLDGNNYKCQLCKKGFIFNYDNFCEQLISPHCLDSSITEQFKVVDVATYLYLTPFGLGCHSCEDGYQAIKLKISVDLCVNSTYISKSFSGSSIYINNCIIYYLLQGQLKCKTCKNTFVISSNGAFCYNQTFLFNCAVAISDQKCLTCLNNFISIKNICEKKAIPNCFEYDTNIYATSQKCILCQSGYYLTDTSICLKGQIPNCDAYSGNPYKCATCVFGYQKIDTKDQHYCFLYEPKIQCKSMNSTKFQSQIFNCDICLQSQPLYLASEEIEKNYCSYYNLINNCALYDKQENFTNSTFKCLECVEGFYSIGLECVERTQKDPNCKIFKKDQNICEVCNDEYFLGIKNICEHNPVGLPGCRIYLSLSKCISCQENMYLSKDGCLRVTGTLITNCLYYENETTCLTCKLGYLVESGQCIQAKAKNCFTFANSNECLSCDKNYGLKTEGDKINCVQISDPNCTSYEQNFPFFCLKCISGFYSSANGICIKSTVTIKNCEFFSSNDNCSKCLKGYVLSPDLQQCQTDINITQFLDSNCIDAYSTSKPKCSICQASYFFNIKKDCEKCAADGCFFCNPLDSKVCFLCQSGYYMNTEFKCVKGKTEEVITTVQKNPSFIEICLDMMKILFLFLIQFNYYKSGKIF